MGRSKPRRRQAKLTENGAHENASSASSTSESKSADSGKHSVSKLLDKAEELISQVEYSLAEKFCQRALSSSPGNDRALTTLGVDIESSEPEKARERFEEAILLHPDSGYTKFLYLAQMSEGEAALKLYSKAAEIVRKQIEALPSEGEEVNEEDLCSIWVAISELYLTDLCEAEEAELKCEEYLKKAVEICPLSAEALQTYGSFLISADRKEEAVELLKRSVDTWLPKFTEAMQSESGAGVEIECSLNFDARKTCARLLIEVEQFKTAGEVLDTLLAEADEDVEVWYLLGWNSYLSEDRAVAKAYLTNAQEIAKKSRFGDKQLMKHVGELLGELKDVEEEESAELEVETELDLADEDEEMS